MSRAPTTTKKAASASASPTPEVDRREEGALFEDRDTGGGASADADADVIVPPPSPTNPIPVLSLALRIDNREQLLRALTTSRKDPQRDGGSTSASNPSSPQPPRRQLWVFSSSSFRALLLRHVLDDGDVVVMSGGGSGRHAESNKKAKKKNKKNAAAEAVDADAFPLLPSQIVGTDVLIRDGPSDGEMVTTTMGTTTNDGSKAGAISDASVAYVLSASSLSGASGAALVRRLAEDVARRRHGSSKNAQFRVWVIPQPGAYLTKVLNNALLLLRPGPAVPAAGSSVAPPHPAPGNPVTIANADLSTSTSSAAHCQLDWFPLETDVLSMECESLLREAVVEQVPSRIIQASARALLKLQDVVGIIPRIQAYGSLAEDVVRKFMNLQVDEYLAQAQQQQGSGHDNYNSSDPSEIDGSSNSAGSLVAAMIVMDRRVDSVTPLLTPLTYEGLLDEVFGIDAGHLRVPAHVLKDDDDNNSTNTNPPSSTTNASNAAAASPDHQWVALPLHSGDALYREVRDQHVEQFGTFLQNQAKALKESHANFTSTTKKKDLAEIHQFVRQIPVFTQNLKSLTNHIQLAEKIKAATQQASFREQWQLERSILEGESTTLDAIEDLMAAQYPVWKLLRLLCLQSVCQGGIKSSRYDSIKRDVVQTYGYRYLLVLANLEKAGLLSRREGLWVDATVTGSAFYSVRNSLHLIHAEVDTIDPDDIAYVSSGYAPLSVRIIQTSIKGWTNGREDVLKENLGGGTTVPPTSGTGGGGGGGGGGVRFVDVMQRRTAGGVPEDLAAALKRKPPGSLGQWAEAFGAPGGGNSAGRKPTLVVFYLGGVTYMELASLRFLSKRPTFPYHILCVTSKIVNGSTMLRTLSL